MNCWIDINGNLSTIAKLPKWFGERPGKKAGEPETPEGEEDAKVEEVEEEVEEEEEPKGENDPNYKYIEEYNNNKFICPKQLNPNQKKKRKKKR